MVQLRQDRLFLHVHPKLAWEKEVDWRSQLTFEVGVYVARGTDYFYMSNCRQVLKLITEGCALSISIQRGLADLHGEQDLHWLDTYYHVDDLEPYQLMEIWAAEQGQRFHDDITGELLSGELVRPARQEEMNYMSHLGVWEYRLVSECLEKTGRPPVPVRWVDTNRGDSEHPEVRSRLVVQETKGRTTIAPGDVVQTFAATPPLEALRAIASQAVDHYRSERHVLRFLDISRAHPHCEMTRVLYVKLPKEDEKGNDPETCALLRKNLYGNKSAAQIFEKTICELVVKHGCVAGKSNPTLYHHVDRHLSFLHHGDDFLIDATERESAWLLGVLRTMFIVKDRGVLGPERHHVHTMTCLHRIFVWQEGKNEITYEADPRHVELLGEQLGFVTKKGGKINTVVTPGIDGKITIESEKQLPGDQADLFRSATMRAAFLAMDRPDIVYASKECARGMSLPLERHMCGLRRMVRYLMGHRRLLWVWREQPRHMVGQLRASTDANWAGCPITRRSTSCYGLRRGLHLLAYSSSTQKPISTSVGESEFYASVKGGSRLIGAGAMMKDLGYHCALFLETDSSSAKGTMSRRGVGGIRHLDVGTLWLQQCVQQGIFKPEKVDGSKNIADVGTKNVTREILERMITRMGLVFVEGRSEALPQLHAFSGLE